MLNPNHRYFAKILGLAVIAALLVSQPVFAAPATPDTLITRTVRTASYTLDEHGITVDGAFSSDVAGAPQLPVHAFVLELPVDGEWTLSYEPIGEQLLDQHAVIPAAPVPQAPVDNQLSTDGQGPDLPVIDRPDPAIYGANAFYPASPVQWGEAERNGDKRILPVRVYPFQYNPVTGQLRYFPEVRVTVRVTGNEQSEPQKGIFRPAHAPFIPTADGVVRIHTTQRGMHRLTYDDLNTAGVPVGAGGANPNTFAILHDGQPVSIKVTGDGDNLFEPGELVIFYAVPYPRRWQNFNVYWLTYGGSPSPTMSQRTVTPTGAEPVITSITQVAHAEVNSKYQPGSFRPPDADHFFDATLTVVSPTIPIATATYNLDVNDAIAGTAVISGTLLSGNNSAATPDHSVRVYLNTHLAGTFQWDYSDFKVFGFRTTMPASWLDSSPNQAKIQLSTDQLPGLLTYKTAPDWVEVKYPAIADAENDRILLEGIPSGANKVEVTGFTTNDLSHFGVYDVRNPAAPVQLMTRTFTPSGGTYTLDFWDANLPNPVYYATSEAALLSPTLVQIDTTSSWGTPNHHYDYIVIVPSVQQYGQIATDLKDALTPLLNYRSSVPGGGYRIATIDVQDIYDEFGYGYREPMAIRQFLAYAYWNWNPGEPTRPGYVLLLGDATYDFIGATTTPMRNLIMPYFGNFDANFGEVPADNRFVSVDLDGSGHLDPDDYTPNMAIGRIPAQTVTEVANAVTKTIGYETTASDGEWQRRAIFSAGNCIDSGGDLQDSSEQIVSMLPAPYQATRIYYGNQSQCPRSTASTTAEFDVQARGAFNNQALYYQWLGHGSFIHWGGGPDFRLSDITALADNTVFPMTAHYACATGYFTYLNGSTWDQALGEDFLMHYPGRGSVVDFSGSGQHYTFSMVTLGRAMMRALFQDEIPEAGLATNAAKMYYYGATTSYHDVLDTMLLFGDPAAKLRLSEHPLISGYSFQGNPAWAPPGGTASYTLEIMNQTSWPAVNTQVTMTLPTELSAPVAMTATVSIPVYDPDAHQIRWQGTVDAGSTVTLTFSSTLSSTITACGLAVVTGQLYDPGNNSLVEFSDGISIAVPDVNCSGDVDVVDIQQVAARWNTGPGSPEYHPRYDLDGDQLITVLDTIIAAQVWN